MKLLSVLSPSLAFALCASAQYFSEGWRPGQPVTHEAHPTPAYGQPVPPPSSTDGSSSRFSLANVLTSGPLGFLADKMGVNMTEKLEKAKAEAEMEIWDSRVPLITDDNYEDIIVNEPLTAEEEADRVWFLVISVSKGGKNAFSKMADEHFDNAFNQSVIEGDLPNVRWGRIDYLNVTYITTKWSVWQAPFFVVLTDRGQTLRFYKANSVRLDPALIRQFLKDEGWKEGEPWNSPFAPGGRWEYILHYYALSSKWIYEFLLRFPRWLLMIISAGAANVVMKLLHRQAGTDQPIKGQATTLSPTAASAPSVKQNTVNLEEGNRPPAAPVKGKGKQRKNAKKPS